ncbi:MAG: alpha/beta hydrolase [Pseudomonadota bacterium]
MFKKIMIWILIIAVGLAALVFLGPREPVDETISFNKADLGADLEAYLQKQEARFSDIIKGAEKEIVWADGATKGQTEWAVIYIHGFSATKEETRPMPDLVAQALGANLYFTRLAGHGRSGDAMGDPQVNHWLNDVVEAIHIGEQLGKKILLIGVSTGGSLITWAANKPDLMQQVEGIVQISPNFGVQAAGSEILSIPWAEYLTPMIVGSERSWEAHNEEHQKWWSTRYPSVALLPMAASINLARSLDHKKIDVPAFFIWSPKDTVIVPKLVEDVAQNWGEGADTMKIEESDDPNNHVIAGRILSPSTTDTVADSIIEWAESL